MGWLDGEEKEKRRRDQATHTHTHTHTWRTRSPPLLSSLVFLAGVANILLIRRSYRTSYEGKSLVDQGET